MTTVHNTETDRRDQLVAGLHELADFLAANPDVPVSSWQRIYCHVDNNTAIDRKDRRAEVDRVAKILDVEPRDSGPHYEAGRMFGGIEFLVASVDPGPRPGLCELCKTRPVHHPDPDYPRRITARVCTPCLGDGPWSSDQDEEDAR